MRVTVRGPETPLSAKEVFLSVHCWFLCTFSQEFLRWWSGGDKENVGQEKFGEKDKGTVRDGALKPLPGKNKTFGFDIIFKQSQMPAGEEGDVTQLT